MTINNAFGFGQILYVKTDVDQCPAQVVRIIAMPKDSVMYGLTHKGNYVTHDEFELSLERDVVLATGGQIMEDRK